MSKYQNIQVFVRCRPLNHLEKRSVVEVCPETQEIRIPDRHSSTPDTTKDFHFDRVFAPDAAQYDVYKTVVEPLVNQVLLGFNCTVFAYGQTGTGKTYTMEGERSDEELNWEDDPNSGVIPRAISQLFNALKSIDNDFSVRVSFLELYNEDAYDLLSSIDDTTKLRIFDDVHRKGSVIVGGLQEVAVQSKSEIYDILSQGSAKRKTAATLLNACSSRSHTIFSITVQLKDFSIDGEELLKTGKINLVDMAGSENIGRSGAQAGRAREAGNINQSLLTLGRVIQALVEKRPHVPYRESKLTRLLQDSLGGKTKTSIIATISPSLTDIEDTLSTLEYASRAKGIVNKPESNQQLAKRTQLSMTKEIQELMERHSHELCDLEFKVRNEVALEFKRATQEMKEGYENDLRAAKETFTKELNEAKDLAESRTDLIHELEERIKSSELEKESLRTKILEFETLQRECKVAKELAEFRNQFIKDLEDRLKSSELENKQLRAQISNLEKEKKEAQEEDQKKAPRGRNRAPVLEECNEYANMTFDGGDEIAQVSAKKRQRLVAGPKRRAINQLSGKKRKLEKNQESPELSPSPKQAAPRVTRSRATRRKLDF